MNNEKETVVETVVERVSTVVVPKAQMESWLKLLNRLACQCNLAAIELDNSRETPSPHLSSLAMETVGTNLTNVCEEMEKFK